MQPDRRRRILFVAEAVTLAHVARLITLARSLDPRRYDVTLACDRRFDAVLGALPFRRLDVATIAGAQFADAIRRGKPIYDERDLERYVADDLALFDRVRPDLVVGDFRLSLGVSATLRRLPYVAIANAYWSPYADIHMPVPDLPVTRWFGRAIAQRLFSWLQPYAFARHARALDRLRARHGLPALRDLRATYTDASYTLYADMREVVPTRPLPPSHLFIGPIAWSPEVALPSWWSALERTRPIVYVTLGSSGERALLPVVLAGLADLPVTVIAATAGASVEPPSNAFVAPFLPGDRAVELASLVISNGGSPTTYQALAGGKPVIGVAGNLDQYLNMSLVEAAGGGTLVPGSLLSAARIRDVVTRTLADTAVNRRARELRAVLGGYDAPRSFERVACLLC